MFTAYNRNWPAIAHKFTPKYWIGDFKNDLLHGAILLSKRFIWRGWERRLNLPHLSSYIFENRSDGVWLYRIHLFEISCQSIELVIFKWIFEWRHLAKSRVESHIFHTSWAISLKAESEVDNIIDYSSPTSRPNDFFSIGRHYIKNKIDFFFVSKWVKQEIFISHVYFF